MAYDPPAGDKLTLALAGAYQPLVGHIAFKLGDDPQVCQIWQPQSGGGMVLNLSGDYTPPVGTVDFSFIQQCYPVYSTTPCTKLEYVPPVGTVDLILFAANAANEYTPPAGDTLVLELRDCAEDAYIPPPEPPPEWQLPTGMSFEVRLPFGDAPAQSRHYRIRNKDVGRLYQHVRSGFTDAEALCRAVGIPFAQVAKLYQHNRVAWGRLLRSENTASGGWRSVPKMDEETSVPWGKFGQKFAGTVGIQYAAPPPMDEHVDMAWQNCSAELDQGNSIAHAMPAINDQHHSTLWGKKYYEEICTRDYEYPSGSINVDLDTPIAEVDDGDHIHFRFESLSYDERCSHQEPSGYRDAYIYTATERAPSPPVQKVYVFMNSALLTRLPERTPIDAAGMSLSIDKDSYCWGFNATLNSEAALELLKPAANGMAQVEAEINGHLWIVQIDGWNDGRQFATGQRNVSGRSLSAQLARPEATPRSYVETAERTAVQLAEQELLNTGWTIDWQLTDWLVDAEVFSYNDLTPLQAIQMVARAAGGIVQTHPTDPELIIQPRYSSMPWDWSAATPDISLPDAIIRSGAGSWQPKPEVNAVFVSGTTKGVIAKVLRQGSAGDLLAPMVTDALITAVEPARERGKLVLAQGGKWADQQLILPLLPSPDLPGLITPGMLVEATEKGSPWRGESSGVTISAQRTNKGLQVRQTINVEQYYE